MSKHPTSGRGLLRGLDAALAAVERSSAFLAGLAVLTAGIVVVFDAGGRYMFNNPLSGVYETTELYLMVGMVFLALAFCQQQDGHVRVTFLLDTMPPRLKHTLEIIYLVLPGVIVGVMAYGACLTTLKAIAMHRWTTGVIQFPLAPSFGLASFGLALLSLRLFLQAAIRLIQPPR